jgi:hypothetical protein
MLTCCFFIQMILMDEKVIGEDVERYAGKIHLKETGGFVPAVSNKTLVTPADTLRKTQSRIKSLRDKAYHGGPSFLKMT